MATTYRFYLVEEDGTVKGTDDADIARTCGTDGGTVVIDVQEGLHTFDDDTQPIELADRDDYGLDDEDEDEDDADFEEEDAE